MKILKLTLKKAPFDVMVTGEKDFEFRKPSKWMLSRLYNPDGTRKKIDAVQFTNGYGSKCPRFTVSFIGIYFVPVDHVLEYSNGLRVEIEAGDIALHLGTVTKTNNIK